MLNVIGWIIAALLVVIILLLIFRKKSRIGEILESVCNAAGDYIATNSETSPQRQVPHEARSFQQRLPMAQKPVMSAASSSQRLPMTQKPVISAPSSPLKLKAAITVRKSDEEKSGGQKLIGGI